MSAYHMGDDFFSFGLNEDRKVLNLAPRVSRDRFHCSDPSSDSGFYVEMVEDMCMHRQARANPAKLYAVLTYKSPGPVLTKKGTVAKRQPPPYQDQPTNFYCAQLLHYGLKLVETREEAKEILLAAFGTDKTLAVPSHILKLQKEMQQEYRIANDKARAKYDEEKARKRKEVEDKRALVQKRHAELHAMLTETPHQNSGADSSKKRKAAPSDGDQTGSSKAKGNKKAPSKAAKAASKSSESKVRSLFILG